MTNNDVLRQLRYAFNYSDDKMLELFAKSGFKMEQDELLNLLKKDEEEGFEECPNRLLSHFLDAWIEQNRGARNSKSGEAPPNPDLLNNNLILKKLRIGLELKEDDMLNIFRLGEFNMGKAELSALFRAYGHRNYKPAGDQVLRYFLRGIVRNYR